MKINKDKIYYSRHWGNFYIYEKTIERFMEFNPPCKECLVQAICIKDNSPLYVEYKDALYEEFLSIKINACKELKDFVYKDPSFFIYDDAPKRRREKKNND